MELRDIYGSILMLVIYNGVRIVNILIILDWLKMAVNGFIQITTHLKAYLLKNLLLRDMFKNKYKVQLIQAIKFNMSC